MRDHEILDAVRGYAMRVELETAGSQLLDAVDPDATVVLIGEATHGTREFYRVRAELTRALVQERGFTAVAAEADWPDAYRVNR